MKINIPSLKDVEDKLPYCAVVNPDGTFIGSRDEALETDGSVVVLLKARRFCWKIDPSTWLRFITNGGIFQKENDLGEILFKVNGVSNDPYPIMLSCEILKLELRKVTAIFHCSNKVWQDINLRDKK